jgi:hypothetical protein
MHLFAFATGHKPGRDHSHGQFSLSDFVSYEQGHLHFHFVPIIAVAGILLIVGLGIWALIFPNLANKPIPPRYLLPILPVIAVLLACLVLAWIHEKYFSGL